MKYLKTGIFFLALLFSATSFAQSVDEGKRFLYYEKFKSAKDVLSKIVASNPNNEEAVYYLGQAEIGLENIAGAKSLYQATLQANPNSPLVLAGMGHVELLEGKKADAKSRFETAVSLSKGKSIPVLNAVGYANSNPEVKNGDPAYAVQVLRQATEIRKFNDPEVWANLGDAYRKMGDGGNALQAYEQALRLNPNYARALYRIGKLYQTQGRTQEPIFMKYFNDALAKDPGYGPVYGTLFDYYYTTDVTKSAQYLDKFLATSDDDPKACYYRASMKYAQGLFSEAIQKADECIASEGANPYPNLYGIKALAYNRLNDSLNAKNNYEEYFKRQNPDKIGSGDYANYATILLKFPGNEQRAGDLVMKAVQLDSVEDNKVAYLKQMAQAYEAQKNFEATGEWYAKVLDVKKNYTNLDIYNAGYGYFRAANYPKSVEFFNKYTEKYPDDIFGYYMVGKSQSGIDSTGKLELAVPAYTKAVEIGEAATDVSKVKNQLVGAYKFFIEYYYNVKRDQAKALEYVEKALLLEPNDAQLLSNKEFISKNDPAAPARGSNSNKK